MRAAVLALAALSLAVAQNPVPHELKEPEGHAVLFKLHTLPTSAQIYTCKTSADPAKPSAWTGPDPDAIVVSEDRTITIHHYKGPTWEATDGSFVMADGPHAKHFKAPRANSVDWLELKAMNGTLKFATVDIIHRIETSGGVAPLMGCDADQKQVRVPYSATYLFYAPKY
jgi:hypothetical protein